MISDGQVQDIRYLNTCEVVAYLLHAWKITRCAHVVTGSIWELLDEFVRYVNEFVGSGFAGDTTRCTLLYET